MTECVARVHTRLLAELEDVLTETRDQERCHRAASSGVLLQRGIRVLVHELLEYCFGTFDQVDQASRSAPGAPSCALLCFCLRKFLRFPIAGLWNPGCTSR